MSKAAESQKVHGAFRNFEILWGFYRGCERLELLAEQFSASSRKRKSEFDGGDREAKKLFTEDSKQYADLYVAAQEVSTKLEDYCDPSVCRKLPFMFVGTVPNERFVLDNEGRFEYYGRTSSASYFLTPHWHDSLRLAGSNPSVLGFFTEQMMLSWISLNRYPIAGQEFALPPTSILFQGKRPEINHSVRFCLYIPTSFNFRAVDAVMVSLNEAKTEAMVVGVQITISKNHSDSETKFFSDWQWWQTVLDCPKVSFGFLWILEHAERKLPEIVDAGNKALRSVTKVPQPRFLRIPVAVKDISNDIGAKLEVARAHKAM
ncbi:hypothetical protein K440DRAFT_637913 [Wilcoxina mikolae CBS 423.85]|nr:hypothetical protein K440DRAFT_637913 [Wilcoxina mikolae CBS 423.85]